jgi:hypothetical protein
MVVLESCETYHPQKADELKTWISNMKNKSENGHLQMEIIDDDDAFWHIYMYMYIYLSIYLSIYLYGSKA